MHLNGYIEETISNSDITTLFGKERQTIEEFHAANEKLRGSAMRADIISGMMGPLNNFMNNLGVSLVIGVGAVLAYKWTCNNRGYCSSRYVYTPIFPSD